MNVLRWIILAHTAFAFGGLVALALVLLCRRDEQLAEADAPNAELLVETAPRRHRAPARWTDEEADAAIFGGAGPHVRPQPAPSIAVYVSQGGAS